MEQIWLPFLVTLSSATVQCFCVSRIYCCFTLTRNSGHVCASWRPWCNRNPNVVMHIGQQTMPQSVILKLTKNDSKQSIKSQCHLAASVENTVSQLILVFTTLTSRPILVQMYNQISVNSFYGISEFLIIATCNPHRIHININKFTLFNYYTYTRVQNWLNICISYGTAPFFRSTLWSSLAFPSHFRLSECYNFCSQNTVSPPVIYCVRTSCTRA